MQTSDIRWQQRLEGNALLLPPTLEKDAWWSEMEQVLASFQSMEPVERRRESLLDDVWELE